jgi:hypothetical protein
MALAAVAAILLGAIALASLARALPVDQLAAGRPTPTPTVEPTAIPTAEPANEDVVPAGDDGGGNDRAGDKPDKGSNGKGGGNGKSKGNGGD